MPVIRWTRERAALLALACLLAGAAGGWAIRALRKPNGPPAMATAMVPSTSAVSGHDTSVSQSPTAAQLKELADGQAKPLLEKLKADPASPDLLSALGNLYYDAQQYSLAVDYYAQVLRSRPGDAAVRTDMGTAFWFMGNADRAISEFDKALTHVPDNANTLLNLGLVKWKGKQDAAGATAAWERLLATNPHYENKAQVEHMLAEVKSQAGSHAMTKAD